MSPTIAECLEHAANASGTRPGPMMKRTAQFRELTGAGKALLNQTTMLTEVIGPPRSDRTTCPDHPVEACRKTERASARSGWIGMRRPAPFFAA